MTRRAAGAGTSVAMLAFSLAAQTVASGALRPYHSGGCGFCTGFSTIGTPSNW